MTINDIEFFMKIQRVQVTPNNGIKENVVHRVDWELFGTYTDPVTGQKHITSIQDVTTLKFVDAAGYIPFENLTEPDLVNWVEARENQRTRNMDWRKGKVLALLQEKVTPSIVTITEENLPWVQK